MNLFQTSSNDKTPASGRNTEKGGGMCLYALLTRGLQRWKKGQLRDETRHKRDRKMRYSEEQVQSGCPEVVEAPTEKTAIDKPNDKSE